jgi:uncharacterized protein involved in exopolysaccharide biosynthesis
VTGVREDEDNQIILRDLLALLWHQRRVVFYWSLAAVVLVVIALFVMTPRYRVTAIVVEKQDETTQSTGSSLSSSLSSLGSTLLGGRPALGTNYQQFLDLLTEPAVISRLPDRDKILHVVFEREWDPERNIWVPHHGPTFFLNSIFGLPGWQAPDARRLSEMLKKAIVIVPVNNSPLYEISLDWPDPAFASGLLFSLIKGADEILRAHRGNELATREAFIKNKIAVTSDVEQRQALSVILGQTILSQAILYQTPFYTVTVVQPPVSSVAPVSPVPILYMLFAAIVGAALGCAFVFTKAITRGAHLRDYMADEKLPDRLLPEKISAIKWWQPPNRK